MSRAPTNLIEETREGWASSFDSKKLYEIVNDTNIYLRLKDITLLGELQSYNLPWELRLFLNIADPSS